MDGTAPPRVVAWEITRSCNLACVHCRASAVLRPYQGELSADEAFTPRRPDRLVSSPILILTGGEPLLRADMFDIAARAVGHGLRTVMSPTASLVTRASARRMKLRAWPHQRVHQLPHRPAAHNDFTQHAGSDGSALRGIGSALAAGAEEVRSSTSTITKAEMFMSCPPCRAWRSASGA